MAGYDPMEDARARTREALRSNWWPSIKVASGTLLAVFVAACAGAFGLLTHKFVAPAMALSLVLGVPAVVSVVAFLALEARRLCDRADALQDLYDAQKNYESLLRDARAERDQFKEANAQLMHQNAALQTVIQNVLRVLSVRVAAEKETT